MREPAQAADGHSYERSAIEAWLRGSDVSPVTGQPLAHKELMPNYTLKSLIAAYRCQISS